MARLLSRIRAHASGGAREWRQPRPAGRRYRTALAAILLAGLATIGWGITTIGWGAADQVGGGSTAVTTAAADPAGAGTGGSTIGWGAASGTDGTIGWGAPSNGSAAAPASPAPAIQLTAAVAPARPAGAGGAALAAGHTVSLAIPAHAAAPAGGVCSVPGIGDLGGLLGFCSAGSSGLVGDVNNVCQPSVPTPEPATGGIDALIKPAAAAPAQQATLYDSYGVAGQSWAAYDMQCSDMASMIGNNVAGVVFDAAKALDRVTITVYQSAAGEGILSWLTGSVDRLITSLGNAIYFPFLAPVVILGAIALAWHGLIRKRATRTIEGTLWMVLACAFAIWLIGRPADFTGFGKTVSDGITQTLNIAFAKLPAPQQSSCVPVGRADPQVPTVASYSYTAGNGVVDQNANELWTVLVCKPWLDGEFGSTAYAAGKGAKPTVVNRYGRQLLWAQAIAANEKATPSLIQAKQDAFAGIAASIKQNYPGEYPLFQGKQWTTRLEIAFAALFAAVIAGVLVLLIAITLILLKLGFLLLLVAGPFFLIIGTHPGFGRVIAIRWGEMLIGVLLKQGAVALVLSVLLYAYSLIMGTSDAALPWALKILMIALVTVAVFIYRKPFAHLFSAVGYGMIGSRERAEAGLSQAARTAGRNTLDAATVAVPGFSAYRVARWARRNPEQAAGIAAAAATGGAAAAAAAAANGNGHGGAATAADGADAGPAEGGYQGSAARPAGSARARTREGGTGTGSGSGSGRTPPPLDLPPRQSGSGPAPSSSGWARGGPAPGGARPAPPPREAPPATARRSNWPGGSGPVSRSVVTGSRPADGGAAPASKPAAGSGSAANRSPAPAAFGRQGSAQSGPFWLRPFRRNK
ncbi:MAG: type IV secretion system protein [Gemmatimonadota bacterium]